ncbi:MAG TPA: hypothetical protein VGJ29_18955 [Vicinamibacterales bacterium]|jgi:hypothetical protein
MIRNRFQWFALVGALVVAAGAGGQAHGRTGVNFSGLVDDVTVANAGSWAIHGVWSLDLKGESGKADFTAALDMERSDLFFVLTPTADPNVPATRNAHTHNIAIVDGTVTSIPGGFRVSGPAMLTGNGATPPFGTDSTLQVDVTGGNLVTFSNVKLTFGGNAVVHFGALPVSGVVRRWK